MRRSRSTIIALGLLTGAGLGLTGCEQKNADTVAPPEGEEIIIPTEAEADAAAAAEISEDNADAAFEELSREIEGEDGDAGGG